jgi:hypothetical protein
VTKHAFCSRGDELQRSLELLDSVLSEFDDLENGNGGEAEGGAPAEAPGHVSSTPEDESPSLGGHQSEDDGYMSMNGRRAKFVLSFRPVPDEGQALELPPAPDPPPRPTPDRNGRLPSSSWRSRAHHLDSPSKVRLSSYNGNTELKQSQNWLQVSY